VVLAGEVAGEVGRGHIGDSFFTNANGLRINAC
jgi:hypothetical protein